MKALSTVSVCLFFLPNRIDHCEPFLLLVSKVFTECVSYIKYHAKYGGERAEW